MEMGIAVVGGGLSGISAALDLANLGFKVYLIEKNPAIGGKACELAECKVGFSSWIAEVENHPNIELMVSSELKALSGSAGRFKLNVSGKEIEVASIVLAPGYDVFEDIPKSYAITHPDVVTSMNFERMLRGCTVKGVGKLLRPSDGTPVKKLGFIQCVGSRCRENELCSTVCCACTAKETKIIKERFPDVEVYIFYMDLRVFGSDEVLVEELKNKYGVNYIRSRVPEIIPERGSLRVKFENVDKGTIDELDLDMVVLAVGLLPSKAIDQLADTTGLETDTYGYFKTNFANPLETNVPGIFVCGTATAPMKVWETVAQGSAAALKASFLSERFGSFEAVRKFVKTEGEPRIGVFICGCAGEIGRSVDIPAVVERVKNLPDVVYVKGDITTCEEARHAIERGILDQSLTRVVFAGCTPRGHENVLRTACEEAGLNPYLLDIANIREQCAWVHDKEEATEVAENLITMAVEGLRHREDFPIELYPVVQKALVIGGGVAGMTAALDIANAGYEVYLVEKEPELGGLLNKISELQTGEKASEIVNGLAEKLKENVRVTVYTNAKVEDVTGRPGAFTARIQGEGVDEELEFGAVVLATGAKEFEPRGYYGYGKDKKVVTQVEFEKILDGTIAAETIVMIQCVGRDEVIGYCSKVCCMEAMKNAIRAKKKNPDLNIFVLYRDIRTYGRWELLHREARERGVIFINYDKENPPAFEEGIISVHDVMLNDEVLIKPDLVVLNSPMMPPEGNEQISELFKIPVAKNGFLSVALERPRMKLTAVDTPNRGAFICGSAIYPAMLNESIVQAGAAALRACNVLSKDYIAVEPITARVDETLCRGCGICAKACEYGAITLKESNGIFVSEVNEVLCKGCGACAAACPSRAIKCKHFTTEQLISMIDAMA
jgi:heterodisulfide reductase subunit A